MSAYFQSSVRSSVRAKSVTIAGLLWLALFAGPSRAGAGIIVAFGSSSPDPLVAGSFGLLDVFVRTDGGTQTLDGFQVRVSLTPTGGSSVGGLIFSPTQLDAQLTDSGYVLFNNSLSQNTGTAIGSVSGAGSIYTGFDATDDGSGPPPAVGSPAPVLLSITDHLLFRLNLTAVFAGTYSIDVNLPDSSFFSDQLDPISSAIAFTSTPGSLTVSAATAVPEPSSFAMLGIGAIGLTLVAVYRHKKYTVAA